MYDFKEPTNRSHPRFSWIARSYVPRDSFICVTWLILSYSSTLHSDLATGSRRLIGSPKLQIIFHKRAIKYRSPLRKMTYKDKGSYESWPPCIQLCKQSANISLSRAISLSPTHTRTCARSHANTCTCMHVCALLHVSCAHSHTHTCAGSKEAIEAALMLCRLNAIIEVSLSFSFAVYAMSVCICI